MNQAGGRSGQYFNQGGSSNAGGYSFSQPTGYFSQGGGNVSGGSGGGGSHPTVGQPEGYNGQIGGGVRGANGGSHPTISQPEGYIHLSAGQTNMQQQSAVNWDALVDQVFREEIRDWAMSAQGQQESGRRKTV
jgi:hypothetical protein